MRTFHWLQSLRQRLRRPRAVKPRGGRRLHSQVEVLSPIERLEERMLLSGTAELARDINTLAITTGSDPSNLVEINGTLFFTATTATTGIELWKSDGTAAGTVIVKDIFAGSYGGNPSFLTNLGGTLFFRANDGINGDELWKSDGTATGTVLVKDIRAGLSPSSMNYLTNVGGTLFFQANDGVTGRELWKSDGTATGTVLVKDIKTGSADSYLSSLTNVGGTLFFRANDGVTGRELWKSDGTATGTVLVKDIRAGSGYSNPKYLTDVGGTLFFQANNGTNGYELWKSDGTAGGTVQVKDIRAGSSGSNPKFLTNAGGTLFFQANDGSTGYELWKSDGTAAGTVLVKDILTGSGGSIPRYLANVGGTLFFRAAGDGSTGYELWKSDGTATGTVLVKDIRTGTNQSSNPHYLTNVGGTLFFQAGDAIAGYELWKSDGTATGTVLVKDIRVGGDSRPRYLTSVGGTLFFRANDGSTGYELWKSDGTTAGTVLLKDIFAGTNDSSSNNLANGGGRLFFAANNGSTGSELWKSDGTAAGTVLVKDIRAGSSGSFLGFLTIVGETLFFAADDGINGRELWKSDGTAAGTALVKDIRAGSSTSNLRDLTNVGGTLFFSANDGTNGYELWKSDGTAAGTVLVKDIRALSNNSYPSNLKNVGGTLFFSANDGSNGSELWKSDGTAAGTVLVKDIRAGSNTSFPNSFTTVGGTLFFNANDGSTGYELWKSDGTAAGTVLVKDIRAGSSRSNPTYLTNVGGTLFFKASEGINGYELWKSDGTAAGTVLVKDIRTGSADSNPRYLTSVGGTLFFAAADGVNGLELWKSDGTAAGTVLVKDILAGNGNTGPRFLTNVGGTLFFTANDGVSGTELWSSDGTAAGTVLAADIANPGESNPSALIEVGGRLFFSATDDAHGQELWVFGFNQPPVITSSATSSVAENTTAVLTVTATDADLPAQTVTFSITGGADQTKFSITSGGVLTFVAAPNFEIPTDSDTNNVYVVQVTANDGNGGSAAQTVSVTVTPVNDNNPIFTSSATPNVPENTTNVLSVTATDADVPAQTVTFSLTGGADQAKFAITLSGVLTFVAAPDFETPTDTDTNNVYLVQVTVSDGNGGSEIQNLSVTITGVNDTPIFTSDSSVSVAENTTAVLTVTATDADLPPQAVTFSITGGADQGKFSITSGGVLTFVAAPNRESPTDADANNVYLVQVTANDGSGGMTAQNVSVTIFDVDEFDVSTPVDNNAVANAVNENVASGTLVGVTAFASDADATTNAVSYSLSSNPGGLFAINATTGVVTTAAAINRETVGASVTIEVTATSADTSTAVTTFTIAIRDVNEFAVSTPVDNDETANVVDENVASGTTVGVTAFASDADATTNAVSYSLSSNPGGLFTINTTTGVITTAAAINRETVGASVTIQVTATSADTSTAAQTFTIAVGDVNEFNPMVSGGPFSLAENSANTTAVGSVSGDDADATNGGLSYSITGGNTLGIFAIDSGTGAITVTDNTNLDRETVSSVVLTVQVSDNGPGSARTGTTSVTINVNDVNEFNPTVSGGPFSVAENSANTTAVGSVSGDDADATDGGLSYSITAGNTLGIFAINSGTGAITVTDNTNLDRETVSSVVLTVQVSDNGPGSVRTGTTSVTITVSDVNEFDPTISGGPFSVAENSANTTAVGSVSGDDADATDGGLSYLITGGNTLGIFAIHPTTGAITVMDNTNLDFERLSSVVLTVQASDNGPNSTRTKTASVTITISNVNDNAPLAVDDSGSTIEDTNLTLSQADLKGNDTDADNSNGQLSVTAVANATNGTVMLNGDGTITFSPTSDFNGTAGFDYTLSDGSLTDTGHVTITVSAVADIMADSLATTDGTAVTANVITGTNLASADNFENAGAVITSVTQGTNGAVSFQENGSVTYTPNADFDGSDSFTYTVTSGGVMETATIAVISPLLLSRATTVLTVQPLSFVPIGNPDGPDDGDYYIVITIDGKEALNTKHRALTGTSFDFTSGANAQQWTVQRAVDATKLAVVTIDVVDNDQDIRLGGFDDVIDISPAAAQTRLALLVDPITGHWTSVGNPNSYLASFPSRFAIGAGPNFGSDGAVNGVLGFQISSDFLSPQSDADGDGLLNSWETEGIDLNDDGTIDYFLPGADPFHKDLYIEVDAMANRAPENLPPILSATNTPAGIVIGSARHGLSTGTRITVEGVNGDPGANGTFTVTRLNENFFLLNGSVSQGTYTNGGTWTLPDVLLQGLATDPTAPLGTESGLDLVVDAFLRAPVSNVDGTSGIRLHLQKDHWALPISSWDYDLNGNGLTPYTGDRAELSGTPYFQQLQAQQFGTDLERENPLTIQAKKLVYRYAVFADLKVDPIDANDLSKGTITGSSGASYGISGASNQGFAVTLGTWPNGRTDLGGAGGQLDEQVGTFMHEFGHSLGLRHGGGDEINFKLNYYSVMNYLWQMPVIPIRPLAGWGLFYSNGLLPDFGVPPGVIQKDFNDWQNLQYAVGLSGSLATATSPGSPEVEFSLQDQLALEEASPPQVSFSEVSLETSETGDLSAVVTATLDHSVHRPLAVAFAIAFEGLSPIPGTLSFAPGETTKTISLPLAGFIGSDFQDAVIASHEVTDDVIPIRVGDVASLDLKQINGAGATFKIVPETGIQFVDGAGVVHAVSVRQTPGISDWTLTVNDGGQPRTLGTMLFSDRVDAGDPRFRDTGRFYFAAATADGLPFDASAVERGLQGQFRITYSVDATPHTLLIPVLPGYSSTADGAINLFDAVGGAADSVATLKVQQRLNYLGFPGLDGQPLSLSGVLDADTDAALRLFNATVTAGGVGSPLMTDGIIDEQTVRWLNAPNAPHWSELTELPVAVTDRFAASWVTETFRAVINAPGAILTAARITRLSPAVPLDGGTHPADAGGSHLAGVDVDLDLTGLTPAQVTSLRNSISAASLTRSGGVVITTSANSAHVDFLPPVLEVLSNSERTALQRGVLSLADQLAPLATTGLFGSQLPLVGTIDPIAAENGKSLMISLGQATGLDTRVPETVLRPLANYLATTTSVTLSSIRSFLMSRPGVSGVTVDTSSGKLRFGLEFDATATVDRSLNLGANARAEGLSIVKTDDPKLRLTSQLEFDFSFGLDLAQNLGTDAAFSIDIHKLQASATAAPNTPNGKLAFGMNLGVLRLAAQDAIVTLDVAVAARRPDASALGESGLHLTLAQLKAADLADLISTAPVAGHNVAFASIPVTPVNLGSLPATQIELNPIAGDRSVFAAAGAGFVVRDPLVNVADTCLRSFTNFTPESFRNVMEGFGNWLGQLEHSALFDVEVPFASATLGGEVKLKERWNELLKDALNRELPFQFDTIQQFLTKIGATNIDFNTTTCEIEFDLNFSAVSPAVSRNFAFNHDLGPVTNLASISQVTVQSEFKTEGLRLGFGLSALGTGVTIANSTRLADLNGGRGVLVKVGVTAGAAPVGFVLGSDVSFTVAVGTASTVAPITRTVIVRAANTADNTSMTELLDDINSALTTAFTGTNFKELIRAEMLGNRIALIGQMHDFDPNDAAGHTRTQQTADKRILAMTLGGSPGALGFVAGQTDDLNDVRILLSDGTKYDVNINGRGTLGDAMAALRAGSTKLDVRFDAEHGRLELTDNSNGTSGAFSVSGLNGSVAAGSMFGLGIAGSATRPESDGTLKIRGANLHGDTLDQHFYLVSNDTDVVTSNGTHLGARVPTLTGKVNLTGSHLNALAMFGLATIGIQNGQASAVATFNVKLQDSAPAAISDDRITLTELAEGASAFDKTPGTVGTVLKSHDETCNASLRLPVVSKLGGVSITGQNAAIVVSWPDCPNPETLTVAFDGDFGQLHDLSNLKPENILDALNKVCDYLAELQQVPAFHDALPGISQALGNVLDFKKQALAIINKYKDDPAKLLNEVEETLETALEEALGKPVTPGDGDTVELSLPANQLALKIQLKIEPPRVEKQFTTKLDLSELGLEAVQFLTGNGTNSKVNFSAGGTLFVDLGIDLSDPESPKPFVYDTTRAVVDAKVNGTGINFKAALGPLGVFVGKPNDLNSFVVLDADGSGPSTAPATFTVTLANNNSDGRHYFDEDILGDLTTSIVGQAKVQLPISFPTVNTPLDPSTPNLIITTTDFDDIVGSTTIVMPDITAPISNLDLSSDLLSSAEGWDGIFDILDAAVKAQVFSTSIPVIGKGLQEGATFLTELRQRVGGSLSNLENAGLASVQETLYDELGPGGLDWLEGTGRNAIRVIVDGREIDPVTSPPSSKPQTVQFDFVLRQTLATIPIPLDFDIGLDAIGFQISTEGGVLLQLGTRFHVGFGIDRTQGVFLDVSDPNDLAFTVDATLPGFKGSGTLTLLQAQIVDQGTLLHGAFAVDLKDPNHDGRLTLSEIQNASFTELIGAKFSGDANVKLGLVVGFSGGNSVNAAFPSLNTDFRMDWHFEQSVLGGSANSFGDAPSISFEHIQLDVGQGITNFVKPILGTINDILDPIRPVLDFLNSKIGLLQDVFGVELTVLELAKISGYVKPEVLKFISAVNTVSEIAKLAATSDSIKLDVGSFRLPDPRGLQNMLNSTPIPLDLSGNPIAGGLEALANLVLPGVAGKLFGALSSLPDSSGESVGGGTGKGADFPLFKNPSIAFNLLLGKEVDLFTYDMPKLVFDADLRLSFFVISLGGGIHAEADFDFGYDTRGLKQFAESGDASKLLNGLYFDDHVKKGVDHPEASVTADVSLAIGLPDINIGVDYGVFSVGLEVSLGVAGGIFADVTFNLADPNPDGKVYFDEFTHNIERSFEEGELCVFDTTGEITAALKAFIKLKLHFTADVGFASIDKEVTLVDEDFYFAKEVLLDLNHSCGPEGQGTGKNAPKPAVLKNGTLTLITTEDNDIFEITSLTPGVVRVTRFNGGLVEDYEGVQKIFGNGKGGDDVIMISQDILISATLKGGSGNDSLQGGGGNDELSGENDNDVLLGGGGNDNIAGGKGNDVADGGDGDDVLSGKEDDDSLRGGLGADTIDGSSGNDVLFGDEGDDVLDGGADSDLVRGGAGNDKIKGGRGTDVLYGDDGDDLIYSGTTARGTEAGATHTIYGGLGRDEIYGDAGDDAIFGDNDVVGPGGDDKIDAGKGNNVVYAGAGNDQLVSGDGTDRLYGGDGDDQLTAGGGADFVDAGAGNDVIDAGAGNDIVFAGAGNDVLRLGAGDDTGVGGAGNDQLFGDKGSDALYGDGSLDFFYFVAAADEGSDYIQAGSAASLSATKGEAGASHFIDAGGGNNVVFGDFGSDRIITGSGYDSIYAFAGDDDINAGAGTISSMPVSVRIGSSPVGAATWFLPGSTKTAAARRTTSTSFMATRTTLSPHARTAATTAM